MQSPRSRSPSAPEAAIFPLCGAAIRSSSTSRPSLPRQGTRRRAFSKRSESRPRAIPAPTAWTSCCCSIRKRPSGACSPNSGPWRPPAENSRGHRHGAFRGQNVRLRLAFFCSRRRDRRGPRHRIRALLPRAVLGRAPPQAGAHGLPGLCARGCRPGAGRRRARPPGGRGRHHPARRARRSGRARRTAPRMRSPSTGFRM